MLDVFYLLLILVLFVASAWMIRAFDRMRGDGR